MSSSSIIPKKVVDFVSKFYGDPSVKILPLAGDASARRYFRITQGDSDAVLMDWEPFKDEASYPFLSVHMHFAHHAVAVPKVLAKDPEQGLILLEDLGDLTLERKFWENQNQQLALPYYQLSIDELIKIHYPATDTKDDNCVAFGVAFDTEKLLWEMNYGRKHLLEQLAKIKISDAAGKSLAKEFLNLCERLHAEPKRICHRDYHSRNIMLLRGRAKIIDFQDARMGPIQYDLVSLVHDSYVDLSESSQSAILEYYLDQADKYVPKPIDRTHFYEIMLLQLIQRCFKACGSFASFYNMREDTRYLKYIRGTINKVHTALLEYGDGDTFLKIIEDNDLLTQDFEDPTSIGAKI